MPGGDGTGPMGMGSMTGWGCGPCRRAGWSGGGRGYRQPGIGFGRGGNGWRHRFWATGQPGWLTDESGFDVGSERRWLEQRATELDDERHRITARLEALESEDTNS